MINRVKKATTKGLSIVAILLVGIIAGTKISEQQFFGQCNKNLSTVVTNRSNNFSLSCYFVPQDDCTGIIVDLIKNAKEKILVQAFSFSSKPIIEALIQKAAEGVKVRIILDKSQQKEKYSAYNLVKNAKGIKVYIDSVPGIAHSKVIIVDGNVVVTGSFNFSYSAQHRNTENILVIDGNVDISKKYKENWKFRKSKSVEIKETGNTFG